MYNRLVNEWTVFGALFGIFMSWLYYGYTHDMGRTLLLSAAVTCAAVLAFNFSAYIHSDAYEGSLWATFAFIIFQTFIAAVLVGFTGYAMFGLPHTPPASWLAVEPPPETIVKFVDTPFENDQIWTFRAESEHNNRYVYVCGLGRCSWYAEDSFLENDWGELSFNFAECQKLIANEQVSRPKQPFNTIDTHLVRSCGADVQITEHLALTENGTIWQWTQFSSAYTGLGLLYGLFLAVILIFVASMVMSLVRFQQYRTR